MRKLLLASALALVGLAMMPEQARAWGRDNYSAHGYGWLGSLAFRHMQWIHQDGPLYSYGPYTGQGYVDMHIPKPWHGSYTPANPALWNQGTTAPAYNTGYAPAPVAAPANYATIPPQHIAAKPASSNNWTGIIPAAYSGYTPSPSYATLYPWWLTNR